MGARCAARGGVGAALAQTLICVELLGALGCASPQLESASPVLFSFERLDGEALRVELAPEHALVLHFWATWCPSCVEELGALDREAARCRDAGVRVLAVNVGEEIETIRRYTTQHALSLDSLRDPRGAVWRELSGKGLPLNLIWDGSARRVELGPRSRAQWRETLAALGCAEPTRTGP